MSRSLLVRLTSHWPGARPLWFAAIVVLGLVAAAADGPQSLASPANGPSPESARLVASYGRLRLAFERNQGLVDRSVDFLARGPGYKLFLKPAEVIFVTRDATSEVDRHPVSFKRSASEKTALGKSHLVRMQLLGANTRAGATGVEELAGKTNYFIGSDPGKWQTGVSTYSRVRYRDVYPGIDLEYYGNQQQLEYDIRVAARADYHQVGMEFVGADSLRLDAGTGDLLISIGNETVRQHKPIVYQEVAQKRREIEGRYVLRDGKRVGFKLEKYDPEFPLVIDPVLVYSTYLGGSGTERPFDIAVDSAGNAYIAGLTDSPNFPTANPIQAHNGGGSRDIFVAKINPAGSALVYSTYLGGNGNDAAEDIAVDSAGNVYITGDTSSTNFPTSHPIQATNNGDIDAFVAKINPTGSALVYSTYLGGSNVEEGGGIAVDSAGNAYIAGETQSPNFPTVNPIQGVFRGVEDAWVAKINPTGSALIYSTYLGGTSQDDGKGIAIDSAGNAYVVGLTNSTNFPTANALQNTNHGDFDVFVTKINPAGSALVYSTYVGGSGADFTAPIEVDSAGNAYVTGNTTSTDFPTANPIQATNHGSYDAFVFKINPSGSALVYSTYLGGTNDDSGAGLAIDAAGNAYICGYTNSTNFPVASPIQAVNNGNFDVFVTKINSAGSALVYSTYLGGSDADLGQSIAVDSAGNAFVTGFTSSTNFPTLGAFQGAFHGGAYDSFVAKISGGPAVPLFNISTRVGIKTGDNVLIGGVIVEGTDPKSVVFRALGPTLGLPPFNIPGALADTTLELHGTNGAGHDVLLASNDNWQNPNGPAISATGLQPPNNAESAILATLMPGSYTVILRGKNNTTGVGLLEAYDNSPASKSQFANISSRGFVDTGANVMIGGFIVGTTSTFLVRGLGPTLALPPFNVPNTLADPALELHGANGDLLASNNDWQTDAEANQIPVNFRPPNAKESALHRTLSPGNYTGILRGNNNTTGVALVEVYHLP